MIDRVIPPPLLAQLDLPGATQKELTSSNRLMPPRWDYVALAADPDKVADLLKPTIRRGEIGHHADTILIDKGWRGTRPINEMSLPDRVTYRALVDHLSKLLPPELSTRRALADVNNSALAVPGTTHIVKSDVASYYEFIDHEVLENELIAQSGDELAAEALTAILVGVMGRRVGIPQVHQSSDVLGDTYIDPVRRRMTRHGYTVQTFSDDFRISCANLGEARRALDLCSTEVRRLGLILNERKTFTYGTEKFRSSLDSFQQTEERLLAGGGANLSDLDVDMYGNPGLTTQSLSGLSAAIDNEDALGADSSDASVDSDSPEAHAALLVWNMWMHEDETEDAQNQSSATATQALLGRVLPRLGSIGSDEPLNALSELMRFEPALTPQVASYLLNYCQLGSKHRSRARNSLDALTAEDILSTWQQMWIAHTAGLVRKSNRSRPHHEWLHACAKSAPSGLAATASASLARLGIASTHELLATLERVSPEWRSLVLWSLAGVDASVALSVAESELDRLLIRCVSDS